MKITDYLAKCLELSERATKGPWSYSDIESVAGGQVFNVNPNEPGGGCSICNIDWDNEDPMPIHRMRTEIEADFNGSFIAFSRAALPKVCEALRLCMKAFDDIDEQKQLAGVHDNLTALAFASRLALCQIAKDEALQKLSKLLDDADGG